MWGWLEGEGEIGVVREGEMEGGGREGEGRIGVLCRWWRRDRMGRWGRRGGPWAGSVAVESNPPSSRW